MFSNSITVSAPGKLHLLGEHSVVYGQPAIIAAVNKRLFVTIGDKQNKNNYIDVCLQESFSLFNKKIPNNFYIKFHSDIPVGSGMGSSSAMAVAIAGLISKKILGKIDKEKINEIAFKCEKYIHGNPSGGDNTASTYGGIIWYKRNENGEKIMKSLKFSLPQKIASQFLVINTGRPDETTKEMVSFVAKKREKNKKKIEKIFQEQGKLVEELLNVLKKGDAKMINEILRKGEKNLEAIGVVSESAKKIIRAIEKMNGTAKICGAGGIKNASGMILVFAENKNIIKKLSSEFGYPCDEIKLGEEGIRIEN